MSMSDLDEGLLFISKKKKKKKELLFRGKYCYDI